MWRPSDWRAGEIEAVPGQRLAQHVRQGLSEAHATLLDHADDLREAIRSFLLVVGACRRRVEVIEEIAFVIRTEDFPTVLRKMERYGGRTPLLASTDASRLASTIHCVSGS
jgi:DNA polymerase (family 10)